MAVQNIVTPLADVPAAIFKLALAESMTLAVLQASTVMLTIIECHAASASELVYPREVYNAWRYRWSGRA